MSSTQNITVKNITLTPATLLWNPLHDVWKSLEKSHSILRAKRAAFTIGQKWSIWRIIDNLNVRSNSITRQVNFSRTKISGQCQKRKLQMRHFGWFLNNVPLFKISEWEKNRIPSSIKPSHYAQIPFGTKTSKEYLDKRSCFGTVCVAFSS